MQPSVFHDTSAQTFAQRESFSNTIILLSMIKSEYYYIIGFSRPSQRIGIGFDFHDATSRPITQTVDLDFSDWKTGLIVTAELPGLPPALYEQNVSDRTASFFSEGGLVRYRRVYPIDTVLPQSVSRMNRIVLATRREILDYLNLCYRAYTDGLS